MSEQTQEKVGHTPGPWTVKEGGHWPYDILSAPLVDEGFRAEVSWHLAHISDAHPNAREGEVEANARLIAAAPELLEAAKLDRNTVLRDECDLAGEWVAVPKVDFDALRAAIAKAEGDTP